MKSKISLIRIPIYAHHGTCPLEQHVGQLFYVSLTFHIASLRATLSDQLEETIDYTKVYSIVYPIMKQRVELIEHLAYKVGKQLLVSFTQINKLSILIEKPQASLQKSIRALASCKLHLSRKDIT